MRLRAERGRTVVTEYRLFEPDGSLAAIHVRRDPPDGTKTMRWTLPDGTSGLGGRPVASLPLYGSERLALAATDAPVYLTEGEKAADALFELDLMALGTVTGAASMPEKAVLAALAGRPVRLWPDDDRVGWVHMARIGEALRDIAASIRYVDWPAAPAHGDAADFMTEGGSRAGVMELPLLDAPPREGAWAESDPQVVQAPSLLAAQRAIPKGATTILPFVTAREFARTAPNTVDWIARPFVAAGSITSVEGPIKSAGKTTLATHLCRAVLDGRDFMGRPTRRTSVVYLTEQPPASLREALRRADLLDREDFTLLQWPAISRLPWAEVAAAAVEECRRLDSGLLVVDTLGRFAGIRGDGENNAGEAETAMAPLQVAAHLGLGVVVVRHERKSRGEVGEAGRGSSAFGGAVDIILSVRRSGSDPSSSVRVITSLSRFEETPPELTVELAAGGYVVVGTESGDRPIQQIADLLADHDADGLTLPELQNALGLGRTSAQRALEGMMADGLVRRFGSGLRGQPYRYTASLEDRGFGGAPDLDQLPLDAFTELIHQFGDDGFPVGHFHD